MIHVSPVTVMAAAASVGIAGKAVMNAVKHPVGLGAIAAAGSFGVAEAVRDDEPRSKRSGRHFGPIDAAAGAALLMVAVGAARSGPAVNRALGALSGAVMGLTGAGFMESVRSSA